MASTILGQDSVLPSHVEMGKFGSSHYLLLSVCMGLLKLAWNLPQGSSQIQNLPADGKTGKERELHGACVGEERSGKKAYRGRDMEVGKMQEARKAEVSLPVTPWKGTLPLSLTPLNFIYVQSRTCR